MSKATSAAQEPGTANVSKGSEIEVKFKTSPASLKAALASSIFAAHAKPSRRQCLRSIYFDTPAWDFRKCGFVLRVRRSGRSTPMLCAKMSSGGEGSPFLRKEVEVPTPSLQLDLRGFDETLRSELIEIAGGNPVEPIFETVIMRRTTIVEHGNSRIEVAFDEGHAVAGDKRLPIAEVEFELKSGSEIDLYDLAKATASEMPMSLDFVSKGEKGFRLAAGEQPRVVKAPAIAFDGDAKLESCVVAVLSSVLAHFVANWSALRETQVPESVHQLRVSLRRMRSAIAMFAKVLPHPEFEALRAEAKMIASALGDARECDVFRENAEQGPLLHADRPPGCEKLLDGVVDIRAEAYGRALSTVDSRATTLFVLKVQEFLARQPWRSDPGAEPSLLAIPAKEFARKTLSRLGKRVLKRGKGLISLPDEERHKVRIALKNLRYAADFFESLFKEGRELKSYVGQVAILQDLLGAHNDVVNTKKFLEKLIVTIGPTAEYPAGYILGWNAHATAIADSRLRKVWKKFKSSDDFWS